MSQNSLAAFTSASSGPSGVTLIKNAVDAILSNNKGPAAPSYATAGMFWLDDSVANKWALKTYDGSVWSVVLYYDVANDVVWTPYVPELQRYPLTGGTANAQTLTPLFPMASYVDGDVITLRAAFANTGAATLAISGLGTKAIRKMSGGVDVALAANDLVVKQRYRLNYDAAANGAAGAWILEDPSSSRPEVLMTARGDVITRSATGPARLALGTAGRTLESDGTDLVWADPDCQKLAGGSFSGAAVDIVLTAFLVAGYNRFRLSWDRVSFDTASRTLNYLISTNGGSSFIAGTAYSNLIIYTGTTTATAKVATNGVANGQLSGTFGAVASEGTGYMDFHVGPTNVQHTSQSIYNDQGVEFMTTVGGGWASGTGVNAIRLALNGSGNFDAGVWALHGFKEG